MILSKLSFSFHHASFISFILKLGQFAIKPINAMSQMLNFVTWKKGSAYVCSVLFFIWLSPTYWQDLCTLTAHLYVILFSNMYASIHSLYSSLIDGDVLKMHCVWKFFVCFDFSFLIKRNFMVIVLLNWLLSIIRKNSNLFKILSIFHSNKNDDNGKWIDDDDDAKTTWNTILLSRTFFESYYA